MSAQSLLCADALALSWLESELVSSSPFIEKSELAEQRHFGI